MNEQKVLRKAGGLATNPNFLSESPEGAMSLAENCVIDRPGIVEKRRGFSRYGLTFDAQSIFEYQDALVVFDGSNIAYDPDLMGNWIFWNATYLPPSDLHRLRGIETQKALYIATSRGILRTDLVSESPVQAGMPVALDLQLALTGVGAGWFMPNAQVGYRIVWGRVDRTSRLLIGAPSMREVLFTPAKTTGLNWTRSGVGPYTVTVAHTGHGFADESILLISDSSPLNGSQGPINVTGANEYTFDVVADPGASGTLSAAKVYDVLLTFTIPDDVQDGDFFEIYRTALSASNTTDPGDKQQRVIRYAVQGAAVTMQAPTTTAQVTHAAHGYSNGDVVKIYESNNTIYNGTYIISNVTTDTYDITVSQATSDGAAKALRMHVAVVDDWDLALGENLYTNLEIEGILQANTRPPRAKDMAVYRGHTHYLDCEKEHFIEGQLISVASLVDNTSSITFTLGSSSRTYTFAASEDLSANRFKRFTAELTTAQNLEKTAKSLCKIVNRDPQGLWYAWYTSGIEDSPGAFVVETRELGTQAFTVTVNNATTAAAFNPSFPTSGTSFQSDNLAKSNGLYYSKADQPDAVPDLNFDEIGDSSSDCLRALPLRDSLMIVTTRGLWRKSGESAEQFTIRQVDPTVYGRCPNSWVVLENAVYGLATTGLVKATESATTLISFPIDDIFARLLSFENFESLCHAVAYESEGKYILFCPELSTDAECTIAWVYHTITKKWTGPWRKPIKAAHVFSVDDKLYVSHGDDEWVLKERKLLAGDLEDYKDEDLAAEVSAVDTTEDDSGNTLTTVTISAWSYALAPQIGWLFQKDPSALAYSKVIEVEAQAPGEYLLTLSEEVPGLTPGTSRVAIGITQRVRWLPEAGNSPSVMKQVPSVQVYLERGTATRNRLAFSSDVVPEEEYVSDVVFDESDGAVMIHQIVPTDYQRCRALGLLYENRMGKENAPIIHVAYDMRPYGTRTMPRPK